MLTSEFYSYFDYNYLHDNIEIEEPTPFHPSLSISWQKMVDRIPDDGLRNLVNLTFSAFHVRYDKEITEQYREIWEECVDPDETYSRMKDYFISALNYYVTRELTYEHIESIMILYG